MLVHPIQISGWVNGNLYTPTTEVLGILPIPDTVRTSSGMAMYVPLAGKDKKYQFLAKMQGTRKPVLPIHTAAEKQHFHQLITSNSAFSPTSGEPKWQEAVKIWNATADQTAEIYYKVCIKFLCSLNDLKEILI